MKSIAFILFIGLATAGCGNDTEPEADAGDVGVVYDAGTVEDQGESTDTGGSGDDAGTTADMSGNDAGGDDAGAEDDAGGPVDAGSGDDTGTADMSTPDTGGDDAGMGDGPCAAGYTAMPQVAGEVVACEGAADSLNQCDAADACGSGWHLCTASEYRTHFEAAEPPAASEATFWLASCIRDGADPTAPSDMVCSDCTGTQTGGDADVSYSCVNALTIETDQLYVGVRAGTACTFAGLDDAGNDAFWNAQPSSTLQAGAFCCID